LNTTNNSIQALLPDVPNFSQFLKWTGSGFVSASMFFGTWDNNLSLNPGEGGFLNVASPITVTFVGEVMQGSLTNPIPAGYSIRSSQVPQSGGVTTTLGLSQLPNFSQVLTWNGSGYTSYSLFFGAWDPSEPVINVGQSFFVNTATAVDWTRTFSVN